MKPIQLLPQSSEQLQALDELYRTTKDVRNQQRAQIILLATEQNMVVCEIAAIVRKDEQMVRRWRKRYMAEGIDGLKDALRPRNTANRNARMPNATGRSGCRRPRSLAQFISL